MDLMVAWHYLNPDLWQVDLHGQLLSTVHVGIVRLLEGALELVELVGGEGGAVTPVLLLVVVVHVRAAAALSLPLATLLNISLT